MAKGQRYLYKGERLCIAELARKYGLGQKTLYYRVVTLGWDIAKAIETPLIYTRYVAHAMRWCAKHERAWNPEPLGEAPYWHPVTRGMIALALAYAKAFNCASQIRIVEALCDYCETAS